MTYLITGVTGGLGKSILDALSKQVPASEIAVLVRSEEKGKPFAEAGYDVRIGDYSDEAVLEKPLQAWILLCLSQGHQVRLSLVKTNTAMSSQRLKKQA